MDIYYSKFLVNGRPFCYWDTELELSNKEFIQRFAVDFYNDLSGLYYHHWTSDKDERYRHVISTQVRTSYSQALETFFALLFATLQAPDYVPGWLLEYKVSDLKRMIESIKKYNKIPTKFKIEEFSFNSFAKFIHRFNTGDDQKDKNIKEKFGILWNRFATDFLKPTTSEGYNSIKHGFRANQGGFYLSIGKEKSFGIPADNDKMHTLGGSNYGASFFSKEKLNKYNYAIEKKHHNWDPLNLIYGLQLLSISLSNIISFLKIFIKDEPDKIKFKWPDDFNQFDEPWKRVVGVCDMAYKHGINWSAIKLLSKEEILSVYNVKS
jgi:hypothetical protein